MADADLSGEVVVHPVNVLPEVRVRRNHQTSSVPLLIEPAQSQSSPHRDAQADDDGGPGVGGHESAIPGEKLLKRTDNTILAPAH